MSRASRIALGLVGSLMLSVGLLLATAQAQIPLFPEEVERADVIAIERDGRDLFSFDALTGRRARLRIDIDESVVFQETRGRVGLVLTDRRALGVAPGSNFLELRFRLDEQVPERGLVEDRVALVVTNRRALGFLGSGSWVAERISPQEEVKAMRVGSATGVVLTNRRALGFANGLNRFIPIGIQIQEEVESVTAGDTLVTVRTNRRILVFSATRAGWTVQDRRLR